MSGPLASRTAARPTSRSWSTTPSAKGATRPVRRPAPARPGFFYPPTVLAGITTEMRVHTEEVFGPVATLYRVDGIDEAIALANVTEFGLGANVWTKDEAERARFVRDIEAGMRVHQRQRPPRTPELPFGGHQELRATAASCPSNGIREFCNAKTVWVGA